jgi:sec-independent protein translocase protein TatA
MMNPTLAVLGLSGGELILIAVVALVLFGANKIPTFMKGLGQGIKEFKKASTDVQNEMERAMHEEPPRRSPPSSPTASSAPPGAAPSQPSTPAPKA